VFIDNKAASMNKHLLIVFVVSMLLGVGSCKQETAPPLDAISDQQFVNPPDDARPGVFWCWLNGNMSRASITRDLEEMKAKGINRADLWDVAAISNPEMIPAGPQFLSDSSVDLIKHALAEGRRLKMHVGIIASSGWNAGGSWVTPDWASKGLYYSTTNAEGPGKISIDLPFPRVPKECPMKDSTTPLFSREVAVLAVPADDSNLVRSVDNIVDLTAKSVSGRLEWDVPQGKWVVFRFVCSNNGQRLIVPSPNSNGLFIDFFDPEATKRHLKHFMDRLGVTPENSAEMGPAHFEFDSMELAEGIPWTDAFASIFKEKRRYDVQKYLPVLAGWKIKDRTDQFMYDFRKTVSDQLIFSHYRTGTEFLKAYHADLVSESGGPGPPIWNTCPVDALEALGAVTVPRGEFWIRHRNMFLVKEIASASHIYGKRLVDAESFTTWRRWKDSPFELKKIVDRAFCEGLNTVTLCNFASTNPEDGLPGRALHAGADFNPGTTWWQKARPFMDYLTRCSYVLRQGLFHADVCYYYGDQAPNFFPAFHDVPEKPTLKGLGKGYDYDVVNSEVILTRMSVKDGRIVLPDGMSYSLLLLPAQDYMPLEVLEKIRDLVEAGATVVGPRPVKVPGLAGAEEKNKKLSELAGDLWGNIDRQSVRESSYGKGHIISGITAEEVLQKMGIEKDFTAGEQSGIDFIHRTVANGEIYFLRNEGDDAVASVCQFRVSGKYPEFWDPVTGKISRGEGYTTENDKTTIRVELQAHGSLFVFFNNEDRRSLPISEQKSVLEQKEIAGPWKVTFPPKWGAPPEAVFARLISWTDAKDSGIRYFSGTATYSNRFTLDPQARGTHVVLNLDDMRDVAEVFVNGRSAGVLWTKPFQVEISGLVREGENELKVDVVNMWVNRLVGDQELPVDKRYCRTNHYYMKGDIWPGGDETYRIQTSGLLGPVRLLTQE
jgi:hypothetical protein